MLCYAVNDNCVIYASHLILYLHQDREASFSTLASAPLFAAKISVGLMSGYQLSTYLPEDGKQDPKTMWLIIIGLMTL